ncbi:MAG: hypothetical protein JOS17DRAFT_846277 [Linnemannia elongata]|nr:MAG: hypothetical protein JOS17DRAFT_846277 [Linnemannia elongata]
MSEPNTNQKRPAEDGQLTSSAKKRVTLITPPRLKRQASSLDFDDEHDPYYTNLMMNDDENIDSDKENIAPDGTTNDLTRRISKPRRSRFTLQELQTASPTPSIRSILTAYQTRSLHQPSNPGPSPDVSKEAFRPTTPVDIQPNITRPVGDSYLNTHAPLFYPSAPVQPPTPCSAPFDTSNDNSNAAYTTGDDDQASCATKNTIQTAHTVKRDHQDTKNDDQVVRAVGEDRQPAHDVAGNEKDAHAIKDDHQDAQTVEHHHRAISTPSGVSQRIVPASNFIPHGTSVTCPTSAQPIVSDRPAVDSEYRSSVIRPSQARDESFVDPHLQVTKIHQRYLESIKRTMDRLERDWTDAREVKSQYKDYRYKRLLSIFTQVETSTDTYATRFVVEGVVQRSSVIRASQAMDEPFVDLHLKAMATHQSSLHTMRKTMDRLERDWIVQRDVQSEYENSHFKKLRHFYKKIDNSLNTYAERYVVKDLVQKREI